jgi:hypothetical protein
MGSRRRADSDGAISHRARCGQGGFASEPITPTVKRWPASSVWSLGGPTPITAVCAHPVHPVLPRLADLAMAQAPFDAIMTRDVAETLERDLLRPKHILRW